MFDYQVTEVILVPMGLQGHHKLRVFLLAFLACVTSLILACLKLLEHRDKNTIFKVYDSHNIINIQIKSRQGLPLKDFNVSDNS